jgi:hypothetical protein
MRRWLLSQHWLWRKSIYHVKNYHRVVYTHIIFPGCTTERSVRLDKGVKEAVTGFMNSYDEIWKLGLRK